MVTVTDLDTPFLAVDREVLESNLSAMAGLAAERGISLRPHAKTHKCLEIARRQLALGAVGLTVATVGEAEVFAAAGCDDLFIAYPVWAAGHRAERLRALAERVSLSVGVDSAEAAELLGKALAGTSARALVELDSGHHRTGVHPAEAGQVAVAAERAGLPVAGLFTFPGHGYGPGNRTPAALDEARTVAVAVAILRGRGIEPAVRSGGSTPTAGVAERELAAAGVVGEGLTELRPGVYAFNDAQQVELGSADWSAVALTAMATVVSRRADTVVLDAGSKTLGADQPGWATGAGRLPDHPDARVVALSEHHATVVFPPDVSPPALGSTVRVAPNHVCNAVNLADELVVTARGQVVDRWLVAARGRNR
ncbi:alanine racemase [Jatrophihabitans sp.]|uniref:alanine racemase n=1 Tax=Jatrophihabitans sp. TaxID=1932789 RepID=UPI002C55774B|nr:alanine racemase [Jatrophihabitans sp.]